MARELRVAQVMVHLEVSLFEHLQTILQEDNETGSSLFRGLLLKELERRGRLAPDTVAKLVGTSR